MLFRRNKSDETPPDAPIAHGVSTGDDHQPISEGDRKFVSILLDESGSMDQLLEPTISGFNEYLAELQADPNAELVRFSMTTFDSQSFNRRTVNAPLKGAKQLDARTYRPRARTPLYDAIAKTIVDLEQHTKGTDDPDVVVTILTDGYENASTAYQASEIRSLINAKQEQGWTFVYLGANQYAWAVADTIGIPRGAAALYDNSDLGARNAWKQTSYATRRRWANNERRSEVFQENLTHAESGRLKHQEH